MRSPIRSRSNAAKAATIVRNSRAVAGHVISPAVEVEQVERHAARLQRFDHVQAITGAAEHAVQLGGNQRVPLPKLRPELAAFGPLGERDRAADPGLGSSSSAEPWIAA
jgi:hypothetical protein